MTRTCDNCRRPVLDTDTACWHCGWKLSPLAATPERTAVDDIQGGQDSALEPTPLPLIIFYGSITILIVIALYWLMISLSQNPTISGTGSFSTEWVALSDPNKQYRINVPAAWQWTFQDENLADLEIANLVLNEGWSTSAIAPLGTLVPDNKTLLSAGNDSVLLIVSSSERLNRLSPQQAIASMRQENFDGIIVEDARQVQNEPGEFEAVFTVEHELPALHCRQLFTPDEKTTYLVAACALKNDAAQYSDDFDIALDSFQLKSR